MDQGHAKRSDHTQYRTAASRKIDLRRGGDGGMLWGRWRLGHRKEMLMAKRWRDKFKALTGNECTIAEDKLDTLITELGDEGLFVGNELFKALVEAAKQEG